MPQIQWAAQAYKARSSQLISQQCINAFVEPSPKEAKTVSPLFGMAGLRLFSRMGNGPIYGMHLMQNNLYVLSGNGLFVITEDQVLRSATGSTIAATLLGVTTIGSFASMADNAQQLIMVDGNTGWIYQPGGLNQVSTATALTGATLIPANITGVISAGDPLYIPLDSGAIFRTTASGPVDHNVGHILLTNNLPGQVTAGATITDPNLTMAQITSGAFMPADTVRYFDGYFVFNAKNTRQFFLSGLNDGTQYSGLDFATASAGSTFVRAVEVYHEQLLVFCQDHTEVWWDSGNASFPFQRYDAALIARGLSSPYGIASEDNTVFWMGDDGTFYRLNGFVPQRISTFAMEQTWAQYPDGFQKVQCFALNQEGHKFIVLQFHSAPATWVYDVASQLWHQRESWGTPWV